MMSTEEKTAKCQVLTFKLSDEIFAIDIGKVREIIDFAGITKVPKMPEYMCGVINLRGNVVPVIDLRLKFSMSATENTVDTCVIIIEVELNSEIVIFGALADSVQEVMDFEADQLESAPQLGTQFNTDFIKNMAKMNEEFVIILDIDKVFTADELCNISDTN